MKTDTVALLNEAAALTIFGAGLLIRFFFRPRVFAKHPYTRYAFQFWLLRWLLFACAWFLIRKEIDSRIVLATADLGTVAMLGFCWSFLAGDELKVSRVVWNQTLVFGLLTSCNFFFAAPGFSADDWAKASAITAAAASTMLGLLFLARYGAWAIPIASVELAYAVLQGPVYRLVFGSGYSNVPSMSAPVPNALVLPMIALAAGKVLTGAFFYAMFFFPVDSHQRIEWPIPYPRTHPSRAIIDIFLLVCVGIIAKGIIDWTWGIFRSGDPGRQVFTGITTVAALIALILPILSMLGKALGQWAMRKSPATITIRKRNGQELKIELDPKSEESIRRAIDSLVEADAISQAVTQ